MKVSPENVRCKTTNQRQHRNANRVPARFKKKRTLLINPDYLDDEKLPEDERRAVLKEIFNKNIREKQLSRIISHLTPLLDGAHPPSALIYGPTGSGKTVTLMHVLSTFEK